MSKNNKPSTYVNEKGETVAANRKAKRMLAKLKRKK